MIGLFPERTRHPDELFYSLCARYRDIVRYRLTRAVFYDLFRSEIPIVSTLLARKLGVFINQLPPGHGLTVDAIIDNHTLLPFFAPFLPSERTNRLREGMTEGSYTTSLEAGINNSRIKLPDTLRFCPLCAAKERKQLGECYWHRLHQIPGVEVCPVHQTWLEPSQVPVNFGANPRYVSAEQTVPNVEAQFLDPINFSHRVLLDIANEFAWLGEQLGLVLDMEAMQRRYVTVLVERGLASYQGDISHSKLLEAFKQYYPENLLRLLQCDIEESIDTHWLTRLLRATASANHPLYHLLFINFLGYKLADFIGQPTEYKPFGSGPLWPCLNLVCKPHLKLRAELVEVKYTSPGAKPTGTFTCMECGFTYYRTGPDHSEEDQFRRNKNVKIYGRVWEETLIKLWSDESLSLQQIADQLGVSIATLKRQAARLGLEISASGQRLRQESLTMVSISKDRSEEGVAKLESYQAEWLAALEQDASLGASASSMLKIRVISTAKPEV